MVFHLENLFFISVTGKQTSIFVLESKHLCLIEFFVEEMFNISSKILIIGDFHDLVYYTRIRLVQYIRDSQIGGKNITIFFQIKILP